MRFVWVMLVVAGCRFDLPEARIDAEGMPAALHTARVLPVLCTGGSPGSPTCPFNSFLLDDLGDGAGIPGGTITFVAQAVGMGLYLNNLELAPGPMGARITHPLFVSIPMNPSEAPILDSLDRFYNLKMTLQPGAAPTAISGGTAAFTNFPPQNELVLYFQEATVF